MLEIKNSQYHLNRPTYQDETAGTCRLPLLTVHKDKICVGLYVQILPKGFEVCANGLIVVKVTVAVGGKSGNKTAKINVKNLFVHW